jgi:glucuronoarabinoxylan endo-1,4-beta-xylanase
MRSGKRITTFTYFILPLALAFVSCSQKDSINEPTVSVSIANIDLANTHQLIQGFGGINVPGWIADMTSEQAEKAFGIGDGQIGMSILRVRVPYDSSKFVLEVPTAQRACSLGAKVFASPWTPPAWMKSNKNIVGGTLDTGAYTAYAAHLKSFADYMSSNGVPLYAVSIQNEPDIAVTYESCFWNASQMVKFVKNNAPTIGTKIIAPESFNFNHTISDALLNDPAAAANLSIVGGHIYGGGIASYPLAVSKGKEFWMTEHLDTNRTWSDVMGTAKEINDCMNAGMNAYLWWYIRRFYGPIDDNSNVTKRGYVISHYARFIRPGFYRIDATAQPQSNVDVTAYKNGIKVVIVVLNRNSNVVDQTFILKNGSASVFTPYLTTSAQNCVQKNNINVESGGFVATLEASSVTTFISN